MAQPDLPQSNIERIKRGEKDRSLISAPPASALQMLGLLTSLGSSVIFGIGIFFLLGLWLDSILGWTPVCMIVGIFSGMIAGTGSAYMILRRYLRDEM